MHQTSQQNESRNFQPFQVVRVRWTFQRARLCHQPTKHNADNTHHPGCLSCKEVSKKIASFGILLLQSKDRGTFNNMGLMSGLNFFKTSLMFISLVSDNNNG